MARSAIIDRLLDAADEILAELWLLRQEGVASGTEKAVSSPAAAADPAPHPRCPAPARQRQSVTSPQRPGEPYCSYMLRVMWLKPRPVER